jgi:hypothetical protein
MFPVAPSAQRVREHVASRPTYARVDALLFNHGTVSDGLASGDEWAQLVATAGSAPGRLLGVDSRRFPVDFAALARYGPALRRLPPARRPPTRHTLSEVADTVAAAPGVSWQQR